jgi:uncharacterized membrane protein
MQSVVDKYFLDPIRYGTGYNIVNTVVYALLLGILVYGTIRLFSRLKLRLDGRFYGYFLFYVFMGSGLRVLRDYDAITSNLFKTPGIYVIIYTALISAMLIGLALERWAKVKYNYFPLAVGVLGALYTAVKLLGLGLEFMPLVRALVLSGFVTAGVFLVVRRFEYGFIRSRVNLGIVQAHMLDASATFMGISFYGLTAQHVLPKAVISATHPAVMFPLKLAVILPVLYYLEEMEEEATRDVLKAIVLTLGLAPGIRDILLIMAG